MICLGSFKWSHLILNEEKQRNLLTRHEHTEDGCIHLVGCIVCDETGKRYLHHEAKSNEFYLPGGKVDKGENIIQGAIRELQEELEIEVTDLYEIWCRKHIHNGIKRCFHVIQINTYTGIPTNTDHQKYDQYRAEIIDSNNDIRYAIKINNTITEDKYDIMHTFVDIYNIYNICNIKNLSKDQWSSNLEGIFLEYDISTINPSWTYYQYYNPRQKNYFFSTDYHPTTTDPIIIK